jgi:hypothetical protein
VNGAPPSTEGNSATPAAGKEIETIKKKRGRPTSYSKMGGGHANATTEEIKEATRSTRMERKRFQEKRRRKEFREALDTLLASLIRQDKDFAKESQIRDARMHGHAQLRPINDDNLVFTRVEMVNQSIYTIERLTLEGQELRKTLADLGGGGTLGKFGLPSDSGAAGGPVFHHGVGPPYESDGVPPLHSLPPGMAVTPQPVDTNERLQEAMQDFQKRAQEPYYPSIMQQLQQQQQHAMMMQQAQLQQAQQQQAQQQQAQQQQAQQQQAQQQQAQQQKQAQQQQLQQAQQQQAMTMRGALLGAAMPPQHTAGFGGGGVASPDPTMGEQDVSNAQLLGRSSTHMQNAAAMLMFQQQQELMLNEQRKALLLEQHKRQNPQASIGDLQSFLSSEYSTPNVPNAEGLLPDYNASSFMSALAAGNIASGGDPAPSLVPFRPAGDDNDGASSQRRTQPATRQSDPMSVDVLVQPPLGDDGDVNRGGAMLQDPEANPAHGFMSDGFFARLQAGGVFPNMNMNGWQNGQSGNGTREA